MMTLLWTTLLLAAADDFSRWEPSIAAFERQDRDAKRLAGGCLFVGSSSIRLWKLERSFPNLAAVNRGFGGSQIADATHFARRIVGTHRPDTVVLYAGDNDLARGKTPEQVAADYDAFVAAYRKLLPEARIVFVAIKPSVARWKLWPQMKQANELIRRRAAADPRQTYVDVAGPMLGGDGEPQEDLFIQDGLHLNARGYALWTRLLRPHLK